MRIMSERTIVAIPDGDHAYVMQNFEYKPSPKQARAILDSVNSRNGFVDYLSKNPDNGETWIIRYRVTAKTTRRVKNDY